MAATMAAAKQQQLLMLQQQQKSGQPTGSNLPSFTMNKNDMGKLKSVLFSMFDSAKINILMKKKANLIFIDSR